MGSLAPSARPTIPANPDSPGWGLQVARAINSLLTGKLNNTGAVTLRANAVSTSVSDARCGPGSVILLVGTSATGAVALDQYWISTRTDGAFCITHVSTSTSNCTAAYVLLG
jgi:hypothetical protein